MAEAKSPDQMRQAAEEEAARQEALRKAARERYGVPLGDAFHDYVYGKPRTPEEVHALRKRFATALAETFIGRPSPIPREVLAFEVLLAANEAKVASAARKAAGAETSGPI